MDAALTARIQRDLATHAAQRDAHLQEANVHQGAVLALQALLTPEPDPIPEGPSDGAHSSDQSGTGQ